MNLSLENYFKTATICFIGNYKIGLQIINKLLNIKKSDEFCVFIFKSQTDYEELKVIMSFFNKRLVLKSHEYGNDIIPSLQAFNYCINNNISFDYIYKLHTKMDEIWFESTTNYLLKTSTNLLIQDLRTKIKNKESNCITLDKYYINLESEDMFCKDLINQYSDHYDKKLFVAGSIFFTSRETFQQVIDFIKNNNYQSYFLNNMYDSNIIHLSNSPSHYLERLFGIISLN